MKRTARFILVLASISALAAPAIGDAAIDIVLIRLDGCRPTQTKVAQPPKVLFVSDTCAFTYQGQSLFVEGTSTGVEPDNSGRYDANTPVPAYTQVTVILKRGTTVLLSCSGTGTSIAVDLTYPATCAASKQVQASIPLGAQLTCTAQAKRPGSKPVYELSVQGSCYSIGTRLNYELN